jgi:CBS domain-containing protein
MTTFLHTVDPDSTIDAAYALMHAEGIRHLPVVSGRRLVGMLSDRDILLRATLCNGSVFVPDTPVRDVMITPVITCRETTPLSDVAAVMITRKIDSLPVLDQDGQLVGIITSSDLLEVFCAEKLASRRMAASLRLKPVNSAAQVHPKR